MPEPDDVLRYTPPRRLKLAGVAAVCLAAAIVVFGMISAVRARQTLKADTAAEAIPTVQVVNPADSTGDGALVLPGAIQAFYDAPIHARVSGYLKRWYADIGAPVRAGQVLAEIDTPDLDQQLAQAKADMATAVANQRLADTTARRWNDLLAQDAVARQEADEKNGDLAAKVSVVNAARANVDRLQALESFKRITAPFDGVVTSRSTDIGALISVGGPADTPLFDVADEHRLRIYVHVPQSYSAQARTGMTATFTVPEYPGRSFNATLATTADAVSAQSGALLVQLQVDNADHALKPGDYAQVRFALPGTAGGVAIPASALLFRSAGTAAATVGPGGKVVIKPVSIGRDMGSTLEIASGLSPADRVIDNPPDSLRQGDLVHVAGGARGDGHARS